MSVEVLHVAPPRSVGTWRLDCSSASVVFVGRHRIAGTIRGRFTGVSGSVHIDSDPAQSWVDVDIDMDSYDFGSAMWNDVVRAGDLLCGGADRSATFRSTGIHWVDERGTVDGDLTIRATTHPVRLDVGLLTDPYDGGGTPALRAVTRIDREVFGLRFALPVPGGNRLLAREISIEIAVSGATAR